MPSLPHPAVRHAVAVAACAATTALLLPLHERLDLANTVMPFLLTVFLVALRLGRGPATLAAVLSVALFDFFFVPPRFSFAVAEAQYLVTFVVMLSVGLVTAQLTARIREQMGQAEEREKETRRLYELARELSGLPDTARLDMALSRYLADSGIGAELHLVDDKESLPSLEKNPVALRLAHLAMTQGKPVESTDLLASDRPALFLPLAGSTRTRGVLLAACRDEMRLEAERERLATVASLIGLTVERLHYVAVAQETQLQVASERLRSSVLSALSHDLRTPLAALVGLADSLALTKESLDADARSLAEAIREQAAAMNRLLSNLLDMARLNAGRMEPRKEWQLFEDLVGASLAQMRQTLSGHPLRVDLAPEMPLLEFDAVLMERVLCNLLDNAAKYSPADGAIEISAWLDAGDACLSVRDHGRGFPPGDHERLFGLFQRGEAESAIPGVGLGLAICRAIVEAHGGRIGAENRPEGGALVTLRLPLGTPPTVESEAEA